MFRFQNTPRGFCRTYSLNVGIYIYIDPSKNAAITTMISDNRYENWVEGKWMCYCLMKQYEFAALDKAIDELIDKIEYVKN